jgi:hypothetical protein
LEETKDEIRQNYSVLDSPICRFVDGTSFLRFVDFYQFSKIYSHKIGKCTAGKANIYSFHNHAA